jgi:hypothetical protein
LRVASDSHQKLASSDSHQKLGAAFGRRIASHRQGCACRPGLPRGGNP